MLYLVLSLLVSKLSLFSPCAIFTESQTILLYRRAVSLRLSLFSLCPISFELLIFLYFLLVLSLVLDLFLLSPCFVSFELLICPCCLLVLSLLAPVLSLYMRPFTAGEYCFSLDLIKSPHVLLVIGSLNIYRTLTLSPRLQ